MLIRWGSCLWSTLLGWGSLPLGWGSLLGRGSLPLGRGSLLRWGSWLWSALPLLWGRGACLRGWGSSRTGRRLPPGVGLHALQLVVLHNLFGHLCQHMPRQLSRTALKEQKKNQVEWNS